MRTIKETLQIAVDNFDIITKKYPFNGLCSYFSMLRNDDLITWDEKDILRDFIKIAIKTSNNPFAYIFFPNIKSNSYREFYWEPGNKFYRKRFLKYILKRLK